MLGFEIDLRTQPNLNVVSLTKVKTEWLQTYDHYRSAETQPGNKIYPNKCFLNYTADGSEVDVHCLQQMN